MMAWNTQNSNAVRTRAVSAVLSNMDVHAGNIISANIYLDDDKSQNRRGNKILLGITGMTVVAIWLVNVFYIWRNRVRDRKWNIMSRQE